MDIQENSIAQQLQHTPSKLIDLNQQKLSNLIFEDTIPILYKSIKQRKQEELVLLNQILISREILQNYKIKPSNLFLVSQQLRIEKYEKGQIIQDLGHYSDKFCVILKGQVSIWDLNKSTSEQITPLDFSSSQSPLLLNQQNQFASTFRIQHPLNSLQKHQSNQSKEDLSQLKIGKLNSTMGQNSSIHQKNLNNTTDITQFFNLNGSRTEINNSIDFNQTANFKQNTTNLSILPRKSQFIMQKSESLGKIQTINNSHLNPILYN